LREDRQRKKQQEETGQRPAHEAVHEALLVDPSTKTRTQSSAVAFSDRSEATAKEQIEQ
jgi:hypothetical protein